MKLPNIRMLYISRLLSGTVLQCSNVLKESLIGKSSIHNQLLLDATNRMSITASYVMFLERMLISDQGFTFIESHLLFSMNGSKFPVSFVRMALITSTMIFGLRNFVYSKTIKNKFKYVCVI